MARARHRNGPNRRGKVLHTRFAEYATFRFGSGGRRTRPPAAKSLVPSNKDRVDGLDARLDFTGTVGAVTVRRNGEVVTTQPYLAAPGHLVALREGDLAYLRRRIHRMGANQAALQLGSTPCGGSLRSRLGVG